ncbi:MAG TPA: tetratricopeptide repeat protein [Candidatus Kapabacteria bacterium]|nr:tetratricopeptide repeat protein [Candidatus Kapabacteria bacterium]
MTEKVSFTIVVLGLFGSLLSACPAFSQLSASAPATERSAVFQPPYEKAVEHSLANVREAHLESLSALELAHLQLVDRNNYGLEEPLLSLDLFRSLAGYYRKLPFAAESRVDEVLTRAPEASRTTTNAALLGALEFYSHTPLSRNDVEAGLARLNAIAASGASAPAAVQPEILLWKAEGYRALGEYAPAEREYNAALVKSSDPRLTALTYFRIAELYEREQRYAEADSNFEHASRISESPLMLISLLRLGAVRRTEKNYQAILTTMDEAESLFHATGQHVIQTSGRDQEYSSPLVEELMLQATEHDRILGSAGPTRDYSSPPQLIPPFYLSEIDLLRGSALSGLGQYEQATEILAKGDELIDGARDSSSNPVIAEEARFVSDALRFERGWSLFERAKYQDAAAAFLELVSADTGYTRYRIIRESTLPLRDQGFYFDPFLNDSLEARMSAPVLDRSVLSKSTIDTGFFIYNDFPERARYYAGVALARAGMLDEAAQTLQPLTLDQAMLYSNEATYQLALIRFAQHSYEAQKLLVPISYERSVRGGYASFLLGELAYRRNDYERAEEYFLNAFAMLPRNDTAIRATAHLERGLSLIPLGNWADAADELSTYLDQSHEHVQGRTDEALFWMGKAYFRAGEYDSASVAFSRVLTEFPTSDRGIDAQYGYAWSLFEANDFARAEPEFERVIAMDSITHYAYDVLARAGDSYYAMGENKRANKLYNLATDRPAFNEIRTTRAMLMLGITRLKVDSARSAMNEFELLTHKYSGSDIVDLASFDYALAAYSINLTGPAETMMATLVRKYPKSAVASRALYAVAEERVRRDDVRGALPYYEQVINDYPRSPEAGPALFGLQDALAELKRIPEALAVADTFVAQHPTNPINPMVLLRAGEFKLKLREPASALSTFQTFVTKYPTHPARPEADLLIAETELAIKDTASAMHDLDTVITRYDSLPEVAAQAYLDRARIEQARKNVDTASSRLAAMDFERAFQDRYYSADAAPEAMFEYGEMLAEEKKTDFAITILTSLSTRYPVEASIAARGAIRAGELFESEQKHDSARSIYAKVIAAHPKDEFGGDAETQIGESYLAQGNWHEAATAFETAKREFPMAPESVGQSLFGLARANVHLGRKAEAIRDLHQLLSLRGVPAEERMSAESLLKQLQPPTKKAKASPSNVLPHKKIVNKNSRAKPLRKKGRGR